MFVDVSVDTKTGEEIMVLKIHVNGEYRNIELKKDLKNGESTTLTLVNSDIYEKMTFGKFGEYNMAIANLRLPNGDEGTAFVGTLRTPNRDEFVVDVLKKMSDGQEFTIKKEVEEYTNKRGDLDYAPRFVITIDEDAVGDSAAKEIISAFDSSLSLEEAKALIRKNGEEFTKTNLKNLLR